MRSLQTYVSEISFKMQKFFFIQEKALENIVCVNPDSQDHADVLPMQGSSSSAAKLLVGVARDIFQFAHQMDLLPRVRGFWSWFGDVYSLTYCNGNFRVTMVSEPFNVIL